jgi:hypothetical protein
MYWNTHPRSFDLVGYERAAFSIVLVGNQIADYDRLVLAGIAWRG